MLCWVGELAAGIEIGSEHDTRTAYYMPVVFPNLMVHSEVAEALLAGPFQGFSVHSAGECSSLGIDDCHGRSTTLNVVSDLENDDRRLSMCDYGGGVE